MTLTLVWVCGWNPKEWSFKPHLQRINFLWCCFLYEVVITFESVDEVIQMKSPESYFPVVLFTIQGGSYFWVRGWNPNCDHSNENYRVVLSSDTWVVLCFESVDEILTGDHLQHKWKLLRSALLCCCSLLLSLQAKFKCDHWNENARARFFTWQIQVQF